jgi:hypothetical protein
MIHNLDAAHRALPPWAPIPPRARSYLAGLVGMTPSFEGGGVLRRLCRRKTSFFLSPPSRHSDRSAAERRNPFFPPRRPSFRPERSGAEEPFFLSPPSRHSDPLGFARGRLRAAERRNPFFPSPPPVIPTGAQRSGGTPFFPSPPPVIPTPSTSLEASSAQQSGGTAVPSFRPPRLCSGQAPRSGGTMNL